MPIVLGERSFLTAPISRVRLLESLFGCAAFSLVCSEVMEPHYGIFSVFTWGFFFILTILIFGVEFIQFQRLLPVSWKNFTVTVASFGAFMNLAASITFPLFVIQKNDCLDSWSSEKCVKMIATTILSCLTFLAYSTEVFMTKVETEDCGYMATVPGLLKVFQVSVPCAIFASLDKEDVEQQNLLFFWLCVTVYCVCFLLSLFVVIMMIGECTGKCPISFDRVLIAISSISFLMYIPTVMFWILNLSQGKPKMWAEEMKWNRVIVSTVLTCLNVLVYAVDLLFSVKLLLLRCN
nr:PREDICTED: myeloid-associated differentiation marker homolog [Latimeria chalumnae]|eukprot:XP_014342575.1 PREDICTED: myeloid-associated differentiation marker homolog [Latimeria chalumnae]